MGTLTYSTNKMKTFITFAAFVAVAAPIYNYAYAAADDYSGVNFGQTENRDGYATSGSYNVARPDGRIQTVTYRVDGDSGYIADVQYSGEAKYAPYKPAPAPVYHAAPAPYHG